MNEIQTYVHTTGELAPVFGKRILEDPNAVAGSLRIIAQALDAHAGGWESLETDDMSSLANAASLGGISPRIENFAAIIALSPEDLKKAVQRQSSVDQKILSRFAAQRGNMSETTKRRTLLNAIASERFGFDLHKIVVEERGRSFTPDEVRLRELEGYEKLLTQKQGSPVNRK